MIKYNIYESPLNELELVLVWPNIRVEVGGDLGDLRSHLLNPGRLVQVCSNLLVYSIRFIFNILIFVQQ